MQQQISSSVISLGRAVLGLDSMTIRAKYALLEEATIAELIATKLLLEQYHADNKRAINTIALYIRIQSARVNLLTVAA